MRVPRITVFLILLIGMGCKDPFTPEVDLTSKDLLVVEGYLAIGGITTFLLSRTSDLHDPRAHIPEPNAEVVIEGNDGTVIRGSSGENGRCILFTQGLNMSTSYRVKITRANKKLYATDYLDNKATPAIDSIGFTMENSGFKIYLNTHDRTNSTRFYSWNYSETWEIRSALSSGWELRNGKIVERNPDNNISRCWQENSSSSILLGSTERLSEDRLSGYPLVHVEGSSIKLSHLYSILVRQYGLNRDAYQYLETIKKNTEEIGTIFDPHPSELRGNIRCVTNPNEQVIGWISAGTVSEKRIFISSADKSVKWAYRETCEPIMTIHQDSIRTYLAKDFLIYRRDYFPYPPPPYIVPEPWKYGDTIFTIAPKLCIDCTLKGSNIKPSYWPN